MQNNPTLKPYLINAFYTWAIDKETTPLIEIAKDFYNSLPIQSEDNITFILNIHPDATRNMIFGKKEIQFEAIFSGQYFQVTITYESIKKIFTKENEYELLFPIDYKKLQTEYLSFKKQTIIKKKHLTLIKNET